MTLSDGCHSTFRGYDSAILHEWGPKSMRGCHNTTFDNIALGRSFTRVLFCTWVGETWSIDGLCTTTDQPSLYLAFDFSEQDFSRMLDIHRGRMVMIDTGAEPLDILMAWLSCSTQEMIFRVPYALEGRCYCSPVSNTRTW